MKSMKLLMSANADILSFSLSFYYGIVQQCGAFWLAPHSIEKYLKAILVYHNPTVNLRDLGHDLETLDLEVRKVISMPDYVSEIIGDMSGIDIDFRYCDGDGYQFPIDMFYKIWVVSRWLRIAGNQLYNINNDKLFGVGMAYVAPPLRREPHNELRELISDFESNTKNGKDYNHFSGWVDIADETKAVYDYPV